MLWKSVLSSNGDWVVELQNSWLYIDFQKLSWLKNMFQNKLYAHVSRCVTMNSVTMFDKAVFGDRSIRHLGFVFIMFYNSDETARDQPFS